MSESPLVPQENQPKKGNNLFTVIVTLVVTFIIMFCCCLPLSVMVWNALPDLRAMVTFKISDMFSIDFKDIYNNDAETNYAPPTDRPEDSYVDQTITLVGGRQDGNQHGYEYIANANLSYIENGTPLQEYLSQVTDYSFVNTLNLNSNHEILNDGVQFVIVGDTAYIMPREKTSPVPFWTISYIQYDPNRGVFICSDDAGTPGDWYGACAGKSMWVTTSMPLNQLLVSDLFSPWVGQFVSTQDMFNSNVFNDKIEVIVTFRQ